jgi:hypothetical protein
MSIQPHRVLSRIVEQVDRSDWPRIEDRWSTSIGEDSVRLFRAPQDARYATPFHFWVHALRDELDARGRRVDLVGAAGHGLCRDQDPADWRNELSSLLELPPPHEMKRIYRMLESECRRSSVAETKDGWIAHFWGHGCEISWRPNLLSSRVGR